MIGLTRLVIIDDANITVKYQELMRKIEAMGGQKVGRCVVHCRLFNRKTIAGNHTAQRMFMLRMSHNDDLVYTVLVNENNTPENPISENGIEGTGEVCSLLECGLDGANVLQQVDIYAFKSDGQFEGGRYVLGSFVVNLCTFISRNKVPRGLIMEVQFTPCHTTSQLDQLFDEFMSNFALKEHQRKPISNLNLVFEKVGLPKTEFSLKHTALQYVAAFNILRRFEK